MVGGNDVLLHRRKKLKSNPTGPALRTPHPNFLLLRGKEMFWLISELQGFALET
jgi:hypothetical protein